MTTVSGTPHVATSIAVFCIAVLIIVALAVDAAHAGGVYKWTDKDGKTRYSETPPPDAAYSKMEPASHSGSGESELPQGESIRGPDGKCLTLKCVADEMEADRHQRARDRAERDAELRRQATTKPTAAAPKSHMPPLRGDDQVRNDCRMGLQGPNATDCDDATRLRREDPLNPKNRGILPR